MARDHRGRALQPQVPQRDDGEDGCPTGAVEVRGGVTAHHQGLEADALQEGEAGHSVLQRRLGQVDIVTGDAASWSG